SEHFRKPPDAQDRTTPMRYSTRLALHPTRDRFAAGFMPPSGIVTEVAGRVAMAEQDFYFNPFDPEFRANPFPHFPPLLAGPPRQLNLFMPTTLIARYADVVTVLRDHERFTVRRPEIPFRERIDPFAGAPTILTADPPVHSRLRRLVSKAFTPRRVRELEPRIREITEELLNRAAGNCREFEAMGMLANALPVVVIAELLGVSAA